MNIYIYSYSCIIIELQPTALQVSSIATFQIKREETCNFVAELLKNSPII